MSPCGARITVTYERREYLFRLARAVQLRSLRDFYYGRAARGNFSPGEEKKGDDIERFACFQWVTRA